MVVSFNYHSLQDFLKHEKNKIEAFRRSEFAKYSKDCTNPRSFSWITHSFRSQNNWTISKSLICTLHHTLKNNDVICFSFHV